MRKRRAHCWTDKHDWADEEYGWGSEKHLEIYDAPNATCMLWEGHDGPHDWVPDSEITVQFK